MRVDRGPAGVDIALRKSAASDCVGPGKPIMFLAIDARLAGILAWAIRSKTAHPRHFRR